MYFFLKENNESNYLGILENKIGENIPIVTTFLWKYKNEKEYIYIANPYIEIEENKINNNVTNELEDIIFNHILTSTEKIGTKRMFYA